MGLPLSTGSNTSRLAAPILTKVTLGIGLAYFAARRGWRVVTIALGGTLVTAVTSFAIAPDLWAAWMARMRGDSDTAGGLYLAILVGRVAAGAVLAGYAGWRGRAWLIPIAVVISLPILWPDSLAILLASFPLLSREMKLRRVATRGFIGAAGG